MYILKPTKYFTKKVQKLLKKHHELKKHISYSLKLLQENPFDVKLKTHKVITPKFGESNSSSVTGDLRVIWIYGENDEVRILELLDIGGHSGNKGLY
jgi:mRNA-degrading endonuclease YafQ of YafQ-DinJ toxin-antitoxin module